MLLAETQGDHLLTEDDTIIIDEAPGRNPQHRFSAWPDAPVAGQAAGVEANHYFGHTRSRKVRTCFRPPTLFLRSVVAFSR